MPANPPKSVSTGKAIQGDTRRATTGVHQCLNLQWAEHLGQADFVSSHFHFGEYMRTVLRIGFAGSEGPESEQDANTIR